MDKLIVLIVGIALIVFIVWWFFGKHEVKTSKAAVTDNTQNINVEVSGGYSPEKIVLKQGVPATINFTRKDPSGCLDHVVFSDFGINQELPQNKTVPVKIDTTKQGHFAWACGMDMFHGQLIIK